MDNSGEHTPARIGKSIFAAMHSAGEFYKLAREVPPIVRELVRSPGKATHRDIPKRAWLRREFCGWLTNWCADFASDPACVEKLAVVLEMAWYGQLANSERRAPGWLKGWPGEIEQRILLSAPERLDAASTWQIERAISARVKSASIAKHFRLGETTIPSWESLKNLRSIPRNAAAEYLNCTPRTIYSLIKDKRLNAAKSGRITCDDKLHTELRKKHGESYR